MTKWTVFRWLFASPMLGVCTVAQLVLAATALAAMPFDRRKILGVSAWLKPLKFDISTFVFLVTLAGILAGFHELQAERAFLGAVIGITLTLENILISLQAVRGVRSHMNYTTALDARIFAAMGFGAFVSAFCTGAILPLLFIASPRWPLPVTWGVGLGLVAFVAGSLEGTTMATHGGHTVGADDGLHGLPLINWSTGFGDLRVAHFFALHALQAFPLLGMALIHTPLPQSLQVGAVIVGAVLYMFGVWLLFRQAMSGRPFIPRQGKRWMIAPKNWTRRIAHLLLPDHLVRGSEKLSSGSLTSDPDDFPE